MSTEESARALNLARRKRSSKRTMCEEVICEIEKGKILAALIELKKEVVPLKDNYICLVADDDEAESLSREAAQLLQQIQRVLTEVDIVSAGQNQPRESTRMPSILVKLPKLEIKKFSGNPSQWRSFWDSFQAAVGKHSHIEDVEKFNFLKGLLEGKAAMAISGLELSNENYKEAVSLLSDRFGSKQVVITHHMDTLLQIVPVKTGTDVKQLRAIYDKIEINVRGLQSLGIKPDQYGCLLVPVIMSKVPEDIRLIILRQYSSENWTFEVLLKCFKLELEAREKCVAVTKSSSRKYGGLYLPNLYVLHFLKCILQFCNLQNALQNYLAILQHTKCTANFSCKIATWKVHGNIYLAKLQDMNYTKKLSCKVERYESHENIILQFCNLRNTW